MEPQAKNTKTFVLWLILLLLISGVVYVVSRQPEPSADEAVYCTQEARLCPDGSYVGRTGPECEFAACPGE